MVPTVPEPPRPRPSIPRTVWALGLVSLCMDVSSEIIHYLLPLFLTTTLGVSVAVVGMIDGVAESTASIVKVFSGYLSDRFGRRKPWLLFGYGLAALSKPLFPLAGGALAVLGARFADRVGKGLRGEPLDRPQVLRDLQPLLGRVVELAVPRTVGRDRAAPRRAEDVQVRGARLVLEARSAALGADRAQEGAGERGRARRAPGGFRTAEPELRVAGVFQQGSLQVLDVEGGR